MAGTDLWIGIDVGKHTHHACALDESGRTLWSRRVDNDEQAIEALVEHARNSASGGNLHWAVDLTSAVASLLLTVLTLSDQSVTYVPGRVVHTMATAFPGEGKTDAKDARLIADIARTRGDLASITVPQSLIVNLRQLTSYRTDLVSDRVRAANRLRSLLNTIFPALETELQYLGTTALLMLAKMCTAKEIRYAGPEGITNHLTSCGVRRDRISSVVSSASAAAQRQSCVVEGEQVAADIVRRLAQRILTIDSETRELDKMIAHLFREHPYARILESVPGIGPVLGAEFLVITGGTLDGFATAGHLASYAGLVPVPRDSGRISGNLRRPKRYNRSLRRMFYLAAQSSLATDGPSRAYYQRKRQHNRVHAQALLAVARKQVDLVWALIRDDREFTTSAPAKLTAAA